MASPEWTGFASHLDGAGFTVFQRELTKFNRRRLQPAMPHPRWRDELVGDCRVLQAEHVIPAVCAPVGPEAVKPTGNPLLFAGFGR